MSWGLLSGILNVMPLCGAHAVIGGDECTIPDSRLHFRSLAGKDGESAWEAGIAFPEDGDGELEISITHPAEARGVFAFCGVETEIVDGEGRIPMQAVREQLHNGAGGVSFAPHGGRPIPGAPYLQL